MADPGRAAAQAVGIKPGDLPDLTIKQVKVYVLKSEERRARPDGGRNAGTRPGEKFAAVVTRSGIGGELRFTGRYYHPNWSNLGWLDYAKGSLVGKNILDLPTLTSQWKPSQRRYGQSSFAASIDTCAWDILGKAVGLPVYRILGAHRDRVRAYASSQHLDTVEEFVADVKHAKADGLTAYKIHPPGGPAGA